MFCSCSSAVRDFEEVSPDWKNSGAKKKEKKGGFAKNPLENPIYLHSANTVGLGNLGRYP